MRLQYEIQATGEGQVKRVLRSVEQEAHSANRRAVDRSTRAWARSLAQIKRELARTESAGGRVAGRGIGKAAGGATGTAETRAHGTRMSNITREEQARLRAISRATSVEQREETVRHRLRLRNIEREQARRLAATRAAPMKAQAKWNATAGRLGAGAARSLTGAVGTTAGMVGGALTLGGGFAAVGAIRNQMEVEREASVLAAKAVGTPGEIRNRTQIRTDIIKQSKELGTKTGLGAQGIIGGLSQFTAISGRLGLGQQLAPFMADVADASGAAIEDVGRTAGQIVQAMMARGMAEPDALDQTKTIIANMMAQAKVGSIEFADLATQMGKVMSSTAAFDGKVEDLATTMGAISQLAIAGAASSPEEAMTAILRFRDDLIQNAQRFKTQGIEVFADKGKTRLRAPEQILVDMLTKTKGSLPNVSKLFGIRAAKAVTPFQALYTEKGGGDAGVAAVRQLLETAKATMPKGEIESSASFRRRDADKQMAMATSKLTGAIGARLLPVVVKLIPSLEGLVPVFSDMASGLARFVGWAKENPYAGIGVIIGGLVAKDIAAAGIGAAISAGLTAIIRAAGSGLGAGTVATGAVGAAGTAGAAAATGGAATTGVPVAAAAAGGAALGATALVGGAVVAGAGGYAEGKNQAAMQDIATKQGYTLQFGPPGTMPTAVKMSDKEFQSRKEMAAKVLNEQRGPEITREYQPQGHFMPLTTGVWAEPKTSATEARVTGASKAEAERNTKTDKAADALLAASKKMSDAADRLNSAPSPKRQSPILNRGG